jgi:nucleotide-binding universal stress UspA family protein
MNRFNKILVVMGHEPKGSRHAALERAMVLARSNHASLRLVSVVEDFPRITRWLLRSADDLLEIIGKERKERLEALADPLREQGIDVTTVVLRGRLSLEVVKEILRNDHDLVIKDAEDGGERVVASNDWHLLRECPACVLLVKPAHDGQAFRRILAAVDPAPVFERANLMVPEHDTEKPGRKLLDSKILTLASSLALIERGELHVLHVWRVPGETLLRGEASVPQKEMDEYVESMKLAARLGFDRLLDETSTVLDPRQVHFIKGDPAEAIVRFARTHEVDMIVMGTLARTGLPGILIGNTAEATLRRVDCSVLAVKPDGFVSPVEMSES